VVLKELAEDRLVAKMYSLAIPDEDLGVEEEEINNLQA
jgi:hypothetical protein